MLVENRFINLQENRLSEISHPFPRFPSSGLLNRIPIAITIEIERREIGNIGFHITVPRICFGLVENCCRNIGKKKGQDPYPILKKTNIRHNSLLPVEINEQETLCVSSSLFLRADHHSEAWIEKSIRFTIPSPLRSQRE
jgi:hypothetical protein